MRTLFFIIIIIAAISCNQKNKTKIAVPYLIVKDTFDNGIAKTKYVYPDSVDKNNYVEITYYASGNVSEERSKLDSTFHGIYKIYWDKPGKILYYETLNNHGSKIGFEKGYDSLGHLRLFDSLKNSCKGETFKCDAVVTSFFSTGKINEKYQRVNGEKNGFYKGYNKNGTLSAKGCYTNGKENGQFKFYDENGNYRQTLIAVNGKREGITDVIYEDGIHGFGQFHNDKEEGKWLMKDTATGKIIDSTFYKNGKKVKFLKNSDKPYQY